MAGRRKEKRYSAEELGIKGQLILYPDPMPIDIKVLDISKTGAGVVTASIIGAEQRREIEDFLSAARKGVLAPVQLLLEGLRIPVAIVNKVDDTRYGLHISESGHKALAALAEKGKALFAQVMERLGGMGAPEKEAVLYEYGSIAELPGEIGKLVGSDNFADNLTRALLAATGERIRKEGGEAKGQERNMCAMFIKLAREKKANLPLFTGIALDYLLHVNTETGLADLLPAAADMIINDGRIVSGAEWEAIKKKAGSAGREKGAVPQPLADMPATHPIVRLIKLRFDTFNSRRFFLSNLGDIVREHYVKTFSDPAGPVAEFYARSADNPKLIKTTLARWIQNEINERSGERTNLFESLFKQAMYEFMMRGRTSNITYDDICDIYDGKLPYDLMVVREKFLGAVCGEIDRGVTARLDEYSREMDYDLAKKEAEKEEAVKISKMTPVELVVRFLWPKVLSLGLTSSVQREVAKTALEEDKWRLIYALGGVLVIPHFAYSEMESLTRKNAQGGGLDDLFTKIDLSAMYSKTVQDANGKEVRDLFGAYVDSLKPDFAREAVLDRVIKQTQWNTYHILSRSAAHFGKVFGKNDAEVLKLVRESAIMLEPPEEGMV
ncbi:MAG: hypothetical protein HY751_02895 [Nitrospinae bacterium]|nr:hypothetical protein [Nitrospinota bacterium]